MEHLPHAKHYARYLIYYFIDSSQKHIEVGVIICPTYNGKHKGSAVSHFSTHILHHSAYSTRMLLLEHLLCAWCYAGPQGCSSEQDRCRPALIGHIV